ncbi:MAG: peptidoglycan-binding protein [Christensenellales bacterium]|nr:peptidoglycan-binding protein [Christensenellales bacterium]
MNTAKDAENLVSRLKAEGAEKAEIVRQLSALCIGWPYVFASQGEMCTPEWRRNRLPYCREQKYADMIRSDCPVLNGSQEQEIIPLSGGKISASSCAGCKWNGVRCFDCRGFTRGLLAQAGVPLYGESVTTQWETGSNWAARGTIDTLPRGLVCCVFRPKHTGMYQGNGNIIHCSGTVKEEPLPGRPNWERWGVPAGLYSTDELRKAGLNVDDEKNTPTLRRGNQGDEVADLQTILNARYGADLDVDGNFGKATEAAVKAFQKANGLTADGVVGAKTWKALGVSGNTNPPADNGNNEIKPSEPEQPQTITIPLADWQSIKAAVMAAYHIIKKYEG